MQILSSALRASVGALAFAGVLSLLTGENVLSQIVIKTPEVASIYAVPLAQVIAPREKYHYTRNTCIIKAYSNGITILTNKIVPFSGPTKYADAGAAMGKRAVEGKQAVMNKIDGVMRDVQASLVAKEGVQMSMKAREKIVLAIYFIFVFTTVCIGVRAVRSTAIWTGVLLMAIAAPIILGAQ